MEITRLSSMIAGKRATFIIDGKTVYKQVYDKSVNGKYIKHAKRRYYEKDLPLGEGVIV